MSRNMSRRRFLKYTGAAAGATMFGVPTLLRAQPPNIKVAAIHPMTGYMALLGLRCRQGAQLAVEEINAAGGIKSMGGAKIELLLGDNESKPEVSAAEAERLIRAGAHILVGAFGSGESMAIASVAERNGVPFLVDIAAADQITESGFKFTFRNFPTVSILSKTAAVYMMEIFKETGVTPKTAVQLFVNDLFGTVMSKTYQKFHKEMKVPFELIGELSYATTITDFSAEIAKIKAMKPDLVLPVSRLRDAILMIREMAKQRLDLLAVISPGSPGFYPSEFMKSLGKLAEYTFDSVPWYNPLSPKMKAIRDRFEKRFNTLFDVESGYTYEAMLVVADVFERAKSTKPADVVAALKKTNIPERERIMIGGPIYFDEKGQNPEVSTAMLQILKGKPMVTNPTKFREAKPTFPAPKFAERV